MSKANRGRSLYSLPARGRGTCPICHATRTKLLYTVLKGKEEVKVCKRCRNKSIE